MTGSSQSVLIVDDDGSHCAMLRKVIGDLGFPVRCAGDGREALARLKTDPPSLMILDMRMPVLDGLGTLHAMRDETLLVPTIVLTAHADVDDAVEAMKLGAVDYLRKPIDIANLSHLLATHLGATGIPRESELPDLPADLVMHAELMLDVLGDLARVADSDAPLLLTGETGTGKDVLAGLVHSWSERRSEPMVAVNVSALPESLIESELFGHAKGAFTGAETTRRGRFEEANGGTLFLDEIGDMPLSTQPKILRALQGGRITRLGESAERAVDFRLVAATHRDLEAAVAEGTFREDLYYRIAVVTIEVPPLRERGADIAPLARMFLSRSVASGTGAGRKRLTPAAQALLQAYDWPGNIRELEGAMMRAAILAPGDVVLPEHLPPNVRSARKNAPKVLAESDVSLADLERQAIEYALERSSGNRTEAARALGISRRKLLYRLKQYREEA